MVREAVAALRADGLVVTRRGSGAYVADLAAGPFRIANPSAAKLGDVLEVIELRLAVEVEAAALAAERADRRRSPPSAPPGVPSTPPCGAARGRSPRDSSSIAPSPRRPVIASSRASSPSSAAMSSRARVCDCRSTRRTNDAPVSRIQHEHARIVAGITAEARRAMRELLTRSLERYRSLAGGKQNGRS